MPSVVAYSIIILGSIVFSLILVAVCGKRKLIQRKECSRRDPHVPGMEVKKVLRREIERRIDRVSEINYEPRLIQHCSESGNSSEHPPYYFRMKAVDNMKYLEEEILSLDGVHSRGLRENIRAFLVNQASPGGVLGLVEAKLIHQLCDYYDHARHHPEPFQEEQFTEFHALLIKILHCARNRSKLNSRSALSKSRKVPSEHDSAIDEPELDDEDNETMLASHNNLFLLQHPRRNVKSKGDNFETPV